LFLFTLIQALESIASIVSSKFVDNVYKIALRQKLKRLFVKKLHKVFEEHYLRQRFNNSRKEKVAFFVTIKIKSKIRKRFKTKKVNKN